MQKKFIALAIATVFATPAIAAADVVIYGQTNASIQYADNDANKGTHVKIADNSSRLGFKGTEDLGGLTGIFQIESALTTDENAMTEAVGSKAAGTIGTRNTFVGLSSADMGTVVLGKHDTPYKLATRSLDVFGDTAADNRSVMSGHNLRAPNVLAYLTPNLNGFNGAIALADLDDDKQGAETKALSLMGSYTAGAFTGALAHQIAYASSPAKDSKATKLGLGYSDSGITINGEVEDTNTTEPNYYLAGKYAFGMDAVKASFGFKGDTSTKNADDGATMFALGYDHGMSKNTTVYALYSQLRNDKNGMNGFGTAGTNEGVSVTAADANASVLAVGVKHKF